MQCDVRTRLADDIHFDGALSHRGGPKRCDDPRLDPTKLMVPNEDRVATLADPTSWRFAK